MLHNLFLILLVCRVGHNEIIGVCRVGGHAEGLGRDHWNEMLAYPRKPIAHWHPLVEPKKSEKEVTVCP